MLVVKQKSTCGMENIFANAHVSSFFSGASNFFNQSDDFLRTASQ